MHTWACLLTNYPIQFICFENRQTDQKPGPNFVHPPKPIFTRTIKFKTAGNPPNLATLHGSLFRYQASGSVNSSSARALCGIGIAAYVATFLVGIFHLPLVSLVFGQFGESLTNTNLTSRAFAITWTWRHLYKRGWVTRMEMIPDRRCSIWFPNKVHRSKYICWMQNKLYFPASNLPI